MSLANTRIVNHYTYNDDEFVLSYSHKNGPYNITGHVHDQYEVYYLLKGRRSYFIKDRLYTVQQGDLVFIPKAVLHRTLFAGSLQHQRIVLNFTDTFLERSRATGSKLDLLKPFHSPYPTLRLKEDDRRYAEALLLRAVAEMKEQMDGFEVCVQALAIELLVHLARCIDKYVGDAAPAVSPLQRRIAEITGYIQTHYAEPLTLSHLSETFYISPYYLSRVFKEVSGFSFVEYVNHVRMKEAQRLLRETDWKVQRIAEAVGFESIAYFGRVFKEEVQLSPLQYRSMKRGGTF
ncbi:AraC family transcriptional regulator [Paenibacillus hodogayensis]|uniref:AraC family transcriptional regulator n=1 Tax=Paenibacillus hodogayensis TaxID=279208 RepID=A0ABV5VTY4_9BACL